MKLTKYKGLINGSQLSICVDLSRVLYNTPW